MFSTWQHSPARQARTWISLILVVDADRDDVRLARGGSDKEGVQWITVSVQPMAMNPETSAMPAG